MADDIVTELRAQRDIDTNRCCECDHWTDHDYDCMVGRAADEIERLRAENDELRYVVSLASAPVDEVVDGMTRRWEARRG